MSSDCLRRYCIPGTGDPHYSLGRSNSSAAPVVIAIVFAVVLVVIFLAVVVAVIVTVVAVVIAVIVVIVISADECQVGDHDCGELKYKRLVFVICRTGVHRFASRLTADLMDRATIFTACYQFSLLQKGNECAR